MSNDGITRAEAQATHSEHGEGRAYIEVFTDGDEFIAEWDGREFRAGNPFGLDSLLTNAGVPRPRNLYLIREEES